jgi:cytoskeleton protein RodZ
MASEVGGEQRCGTGARLRGARERQGLTVSQAAERLHVDAWALEALEAEDFAALGADVYVRGHLRRYAELIGESPAELQELYTSSRQAARPDLTRIPRGEPGARLMLPGLLGLVGFALVVLLWWVLTLPGEEPQPRAAAPPSAPDATTTAGAADEAAPAATASPTRLALKFSALSWVEVSDATGQRLLQGLYTPDSARALSGAAPLRLILGNAPAVALRVNDQPVTLAGLVRHDGSARLLIDGDGRTTAAPPRLAHGD